MGDGDRGILIRQQGSARESEMLIRASLRDEAGTVELLLQIVCGKAAGRCAVDVDARADLMAPTQRSSSATSSCLAVRSIADASAKAILRMVVTASSSRLTSPAETWKRSRSDSVEIVERVSGRPLEALVADVAAAMGADSLTWRPDRRRAVATEQQPHRGLVRGEVHDELAHALGRPAGHAGLFGTVDDVVALAGMIRDRGDGARSRVLSSESVRLMSTPVVRAEAGYGQALGLRVRDAAWMGSLDAVGHTGFTGTCFAVEPASGGLGVLLLNRVHPTRIDADVADVRRRFLRPLGVDPRTTG